MDQELKAYLDAMQQGLITRMVDLNTETRKYLSDRMETHDAETREHAEQLHAQAIGHAEHLHTEARVLIEDVATKVGLVWEGVQAIKETLDSKLEDHEQRMQSLERKAL